jgi:molecular chaperone GrpE (heat shock protein)
MTAPDPGDPLPDASAAEGSPSAAEGDRRAVAVLADAVGLLRDQLDHVHRRNEELAAEARSRADEPLVRDLLLLVDSCGRTARSWAERAEAEPADVATALIGVAEDLTLVLARAGVEAFEPELGQAFDRRSARAVRVEPAPAPEASGRVVKVLRPGYRSGDRVIRYAEVVVGLHQEPRRP